MKRSSWEPREIVLIWAEDRRGAIGQGNSLPWRIPEDMEYFRHVTKGRAVIMGRKTWQSLPANSQPLSGRQNIVLTRDGFRPEGGAATARSIEHALEIAASRIVFVIGGREVYDAAMSYATILYVTEVDTFTPNADTFAPKISDKDWQRYGRTEHWTVSRGSTPEGLRFRHSEYRRRSASDTAA